MVDQFPLSDEIGGRGISSDRCTNELSVMHYRSRACLIDGHVVLCEDTTFQAYESRESAVCLKARSQQQVLEVSAQAAGRNQKGEDTTNQRTAQ